MVVVVFDFLVLDGFDCWYLVVWFGDMYGDFLEESGVGVYVVFLWFDLVYCWLFYFEYLWVGRGFDLGCGFCFYYGVVDDCGICGIDVWFYGVGGGGYVVIGDW